jgi:hypothetical protein
MKHEELKELIFRLRQENPHAEPDEIEGLFIGAVAVRDDPGALHSAYEFWFSEAWEKLQHERPAASTA